MKTNIYVLCEPYGEIRYVGKTGLKLTARLYFHLLESRRGVKNHKCNWIRSVLNVGKLPSIQLIGEVEGNGSKEEIAWIAYGRSEGWRLVNGTDGGEGGALGQKLSIETCRKIGDACRGEKHYLFGKSMSEEQKEKIRNSCKDRVHSKETKLKMSISQKNSLASINHMRKICNGNIGKHHSKETRRKIGLANSIALKGRMIPKHIRIMGNKACQERWRKIRELKAIQNAS